MSRARASLGRLGERLAAQRLEALGYSVVERNYRCVHGEIDLVARCGQDWVFVEVRSRRGQAFGLPEASLTPRKRRHLLAAAQNYLLENQLAEVPWRIDVVAVEFAAGGRLARLEVYANAITGDSWR